jgi:origin recognition complex subunit 5
MDAAPPSPLPRTPSRSAPADINTFSTSYGTAATGKTAVVSTIMQRCKLRHAIVDCVEATTPRLLYEQVLWQLQPGGVSKPRPRCESLAKFVREITGLADAVERDASHGHASTPMPRTSYIVLDNAERLRALPTLLPALLRLQDLTNTAICPVLISSIIWEKFRGGTGFTEPYVVHFPAYSKAATLEILALDCPQPGDAELHHQFAVLLFDVFHGPCRDLNELRHLATLLFPLYRAPVKSGKITAGNSAALYKSISPHFRQQLSRLYLRETSTAEWSAAQDGDGSSAVGGAQSSQIELPFMSKHLVVAAYLASFNPAGSDVRVFAKRQSSSRGRVSKKARTTDKTPQIMIGPKAFPLERLLAILFSLMEVRIPASAEVYSQLSSLVTLGLVSLASGADNLDAPRYKCMMTYTEVSKIAAGLEIELRSYLHDAVR